MSKLNRLYNADIKYSLLTNASEIREGLYKYTKVSDVTFISASAVSKPKNILKEGWAFIWAYRVKLYTSNYS